MNRVLSLSVSSWSPAFSGTIGSPWDSIGLRQLADPSRMTIAKFRESIKKVRARISSLRKRPQKEEKIKISFSGDREVLKNLLRKKQLLDKKDPKHEQIKTVLLFPGGGQKGVFQAGVGRGLLTVGLGDAFDDTVSVSTGAGVAYYFLGKEKEGIRIYYEDNIKNHVISFLRPWKVLDIDVLEQVVRNARQNHLETFTTSRSNCWVGVTDVRTGKGKFFNAKMFSDPVPCILASMCIPVVDGGESIAIEGEKYVDGAVANPLPISFAIEELQATDILVVSTEKPGYKTYIHFAGFFNKVFSHVVSLAAWEGLMERFKYYNEEMKYIMGDKKLPNGVRLAVIYPNTSKLTMFTMDAVLLKNWAIAAEEFTIRLFSDIQGGIKIKTFLATLSSQIHSLWEKIRQIRY